MDRLNVIYGHKIVKPQSCLTLTISKGKLNVIDWFLDKCIGWALAAFIALCFAGMFAGAHADAEARRTFMTECQKERKDYECTAMWRAGESRAQVVPMPIVIPSGR